MGSNSNRTRQPCKVAGCDGMSRAMSGLCVTHRQVPVEQVKLRDFTAADVLGCADSARVGNWTAAGKARREAELLRRRAQWASEATQTPQTVSDATTSVIASPAGSECVSCGLEHCGTHADGQEVPEVANAGAWALVWIAAVAVGVAFLLSPLGQSMLGAIGGGK